MNLIKSFTFAALACISTLAYGQNKEEGYVFKEIKRLPATCVKSQDRAGTCWSWSAMSFFESEMIRMGKDSVSLAPLLPSRYCFSKKGEKYVRLHGHLNFGQGGATEDVLLTNREVGIVPLSIYSGLNYGEPVHAQGEIEDVLHGYLDGVVENGNKRLSTAWKRGLDAILDEYLGAIPENFEYKGKSYTPQSFAKATGLNMDDYISITSYTHHPFYTQFALEIEDNWQFAKSYNVPLDDLMAIIDNAIDKGYTVCWGSDISEPGFNGSIAIVPDINTKEMSDAEIAKWVKMSNEEKQRSFFSKPGKEKEITQEMRQEAYDNYQTTDDHGMHIIGKAEDQNGNKYYIVKNSWGNYGKYNGYLYASYPFVAYKTMAIDVHKDAIPKDIRKKMGIK